MVTAKQIKMFGYPLREADAGRRPPALSSDNAICVDNFEVSGTVLFTQTTMIREDKIMGLRFKEVVDSNVTIRGRKYSSVSVNNGYNKHLIIAKFREALPAARSMVAETEQLVEASLKTVMKIKVGPGIHDDPPLLPKIVEDNLIEHFKVPDDRKRTNVKILSAIAGLQQANPALFKTSQAARNSATPCSYGNALIWEDLLNYLRQSYLLIGQFLRGAFVIDDLPYADRGQGTCGQVEARKFMVLHNDANSRFYDPKGAEFPIDPSNIQIDFIWTQTVSPMRIARTIVHEAAHLRAGCNDNAYYHNRPGYLSLDTNQARSNADSLSHFAISTLQNGRYADIVG